MEPYEVVSEDILYRQLNERLVDLVPMSASSRIVDLGCGTGSLSKIVLDRGLSPRSIVALDPDPTMCRAATHALGPAATVRQASAEDVLELFSRASVDIVLLGNCIHLLADIDKSIADIAQVLVPGGILAFNTAFFDGAEDPRDRALYWRLVLEANRALEKSDRRERGIGSRPLAKRPLTPALYRNVLTSNGFSVKHEETQPVTIDAEFVSKILSAPVFAAGVLPGIDPQVATQALHKAVLRILRTSERQFIVRKWLFMMAQRD